MSAEAARGLAAAVLWNPGGAKALLDILNTAPDCVKYKQGDLYGPLGMMLHRQYWPMEPAAGWHGFPAELLPACEAFGQEWLQQRFSKEQFAAILTALLERLGIPLHKPGTGGWSATRTVSEADPDPLAGYFPAEGPGSPGGAV
jgi:hypothetical protein